jgi:hypothetical protein
VTTLSVTNAWSAFTVFELAMRGGRQFWAEMTAELFTRYFAPKLRRKLFEPNELEWRGRHRVNAQKHILHALRFKELFYGIDF